MAKFKKTAKKSTGKSGAKRGADKPGAQEQAERLSKTLSESAQQIWLAGVGAFGRAQAEGTKLFEGLVKEGLNLEQTARKFTGGQAGALRDAVESKVGQARERLSALLIGQRHHDQVRYRNGERLFVDRPGARAAT